MVLFLLLSYPVIDSLIERYNLYTPDSIRMTAECSIVPEVKFIVSFTKGKGLEIISASEEPDVSEPFACELIKGMVLLTGIGLTELWYSFGGSNFIDTLFIKNNWVTILPKDTTLVASAQIKIENWLIKEAKIKTENQNIYAKIEYKAELPVRIKVQSNNSKFTITHYYESKLRIPKKTEIVGESADIPDELKHVTITYSKIR